MTLNSFVFQNETSSIVAENPQEGAAKSNDPENIVPNANDTTLDNITESDPLSDKVVVVQNPMIMEVQDHNYNLAEDNQSRIGLETNIEIPVPVAKSSLKRSQSDDSDTDSFLCKKIKVEPNTQNTYSDDSDVIFVPNTQHQPIDLEYTQDSFQRHVQEEEALDPFYGYGRQKSAPEIELEECLTEQEIENEISELPVNQIDESDSEPEVGMEMHDESESFSGGSLDMTDFQELTQGPPIEKEIELEADGFSQLDDIRQPSGSHDPVPLAIPKPLTKVSKKTKEKTRALHEFFQQQKEKNKDTGTKPKIDRPRPCSTLNNWKGNPQKTGNVIEDVSMISSPDLSRDVPMAIDELEISESIEPSPIIQQTNTQDSLGRNCSIFVSTQVTDDICRAYSIVPPPSKKQKVSKTIDGNIPNIQYPIYRMPNLIICMNNEGSIVLPYVEIISFLFQPDQKNDNEDGLSALISLRGFSDDHITQAVISDADSLQLIMQIDSNTYRRLIKLLISQKRTMKFTKTKISEKGSLVEKVTSNFFKSIFLSTKKKNVSLKITKNPDKLNRRVNGGCVEAVPRVPELPNIQKAIPMEIVKEIQKLKTAHSK